MKLNKPRMPTGATVAHLAYYVAEHLGCDPIIFVGQDLGFSDGLCYTPGTSYEDVWRPELARFCTVEMKQWEQIRLTNFLIAAYCDKIVSAKNAAELSEADKQDRLSAYAKWIGTILY